MLKRDNKDTKRYETRTSFFVRHFRLCIQMQEGNKITDWNSRGCTQKEDNWE
jgi:hypothetical protein